MATESKLLIPTDQEDALDRSRPILQDTADEEVYAAHWREKRGLLWAVGSLALSSMLSTAGLVTLARRPVQNRYIVIPALGEATPVKYNDLLYSPRTPEAKKYLEHWVTYRYRRLRASAAKEFPNNYLFLEKGLGAAMMSEDGQRNVLANVLAGVTPENDIHIVGTQLLSFGKQSYGSHTYTGGLGVVNFYRNFGGSAQSRPHSEHSTVAIEFYLNPDQVDEQSQLYPQYQDINPLGLTIVKRPVENILNDEQAVPPTNPPAKGAGK